MKRTAMTRIRIRECIRINDCSVLFAVEPRHGYIILGDVVCVGEGGGGTRIPWFPQPFGLIWIRKRYKDQFDLVYNISHSVRDALDTSPNVTLDIYFKKVRYPDTSLIMVVNAWINCTYYFRAAAKTDGLDVRILYSCRILINVRVMQHLAPCHIRTPSSKYVVNDISKQHARTRILL